MRNYQRNTGESRYRPQRVRNVQNADSRWPLKSLRWVGAEPWSYWNSAKFAPVPDRSRSGFPEPSARFQQRLSPEQRADGCVPQKSGVVLQNSNAQIGAKFRYLRGFSSARYPWVRDCPGDRAMPVRYREYRAHPEGIPKYPPGPRCIVHRPHGRLRFRHRCLDPRRSPPEQGDHPGPLKPVVRRRFQCFLPRFPRPWPGCFERAEKRGSCLRRNRKSGYLQQGDGSGFQPGKYDPKPQ